MQKDQRALTRNRCTSKQVINMRTSPKPEARPQQRLTKACVRKSIVRLLFGSNTTPVPARDQSRMSVLRDLLRSTAAETLLRPTSVLRSSVTTPAASGTAGRTSRPVRWCCCNVESSTVFRSRQASQQTRSLTGQSSCESAVCATPSGAFARQDVRCCCAHAWSRI